MGRLNEIRDRMGKANIGAAVYSIHNTVGCDCDTKQFVTNAPTDIAYLLRLVEELEKELRDTLAVGGCTPDEIAETLETVRNSTGESDG